MTPKEERENLNLKLFTLEGVFFIFASSFLDPNSIIPSFINQFTDSGVLIGLATTIRNCGWLLPQLFVAGYAHSFKYKKTLLLITAGIMRFSAGFLALTALLSPKMEPYLVILFFYIFFIIYSFADGTCGIPWLDLIAKGIDPRKRGFLFGRNHFIGGSLAFVGGFVTKGIITYVEFPKNFALVFLIGFVLMILSYIFLFGVDEPPSKISKKNLTFLDFIRSIPVHLRNPEFSSMIITNTLVRFLFLSLPFYVVFGEEIMDFPREMVGYLVSAQTLGYVVSSRFWGYLCDNANHKMVIFGTCLSAAAAPILALTVYITGLYLNIMAFPLFLVVFLTMGFTLSGIWIGFNNYILNISNDENRPLYFGLYNTLSAPMTFFPLLGGKIIDNFSYIHLFIITAVFLVIALISSLFIAHSRPRSQKG